MPVQLLRIVYRLHSVFLCETVMFEFFRGWKRKLACVILTVALVLAAAWVRSRTIADTIHRRVDENTQDVYLSCIHGFVWMRTRYTDSNHNGLSSSPKWEWNVSKSSDYDEDSWQNVSGCWFGCRVGYGDSQIQVSILVVRYLTVTVPLTLIAMCLLLSKPRASIAPPITPAGENV